MATSKNTFCHFDRSDAKHREAEKSIKNQIPRLVPTNRDSLGMTIY
jgi:hypothetical protein